MLIEEVTEGIAPAYGKRGGRVVRKYRCTSGPRKGRVVAKPSTCTAPKNLSKRLTLQKTKMRKGGTIKAKTKITKRTNPSSIRMRRMNRSKKRSRVGNSKRRRI